MSNKNHYRKAFKSDHLGVADLEEYIEAGVTLVFTIKEVRQYLLDPNIKGSGVMVAGKRISANIAFFVEPIKPMVLNATNSKIVQSFHPAKSPMVEDWTNVPIELYVDKQVKMKGDVVGGIRINPIQPKTSKPKPAFTDAIFKKAFEAKATIDKIKEKYTITPSVEAAYMKYATEKALQNA